MTHAIRTETLTKDYPVGFWRARSHRVLDGLTLEIDGGEVFGFLGPNGAGKTTTLKLLLQLVFPTSGHGEILGRPLGDVESKRRIGYLPEQPYFYDHLTAEELLHYFAGLFGYRSADRTRRVAGLLDELGIGAERRMQLRRFSKGMLQRVGIAQALINDPDVLFLDEPMSGLDPLGRKDVRSLILRLRDRGCAVFFCSHILADAEAVCSRVGILVGGRLRAQGRLTDLAFDVRGWELVVDDLDRSTLDGLGTAIVRTTPITGRRYAIELSAGCTPDRVLAHLSTGGARLVSLNPVRHTLEDIFERTVRAAGGQDPAEAATPGRGATRERSRNVVGQSP